MRDKDILYIIGLFVFLFLIFRYMQGKQTKTNETRENLYKSGVMVKGEVILTQSYFWTMYDVYLGISRGSSRQLNYQFVTQNGHKFYGKDGVVFCLEPKLFFANAGHKINIIYDDNDPINNLIFKNRENKKYKYDKKEE